jgi:hypothetical protein
MMRSAPKAGPQIRKPARGAKIISFIGLWNIRGTVRSSKFNSSDVTPNLIALGFTSAKVV